MVRITSEIMMSEDERLIEAYGLSTDTKPTTGVITGSVFIEVDTSNAFFFDEVSNTWIKAGESNG